MKRVYLDHNASAPLSSSVAKWICEGTLPHANPSSVHTSGKKVKREIEKVKDFLFESFGLKQSEFNIFFHSGATEGINTVVKGHAGTQDKINFLCQKTDHSCVYNLQSCLEKMGHDVAHYDVSDLSDLESLSRNALVNWTWVNNETGIVTGLDHIANLKEKYGF